MPAYQAPAKMGQLTDVAQLNGGDSLSLEGTVSVIKPEQLQIPDNIGSINWQGGFPKSLMSKEEKRFTYTGRFILKRRAPDDPSFAVYNETDFKGGDKSLEGCIDYVVMSEAGKLMLVVGTKGPLQATRDDKLEARMLYQGDVTDEFWGDPEDAHSYSLLKKEGRIVLRIEPSNKADSAQTKA